MKASDDFPHLSNVNKMMEQLAFLFSTSNPFFFSFAFWKKKLNLTDRSSYYRSVRIRFNYVDLYIGTVYSFYARRIK